MAIGLTLALREGTRLWEQDELARAREAKEQEDIRAYMSAEASRVRQIEREEKLAMAENRQIISKYINKIGDNPQAFAEGINEIQGPRADGARWSASLDKDGWKGGLTLQLIGTDGKPVVGEDGNPLTYSVPTVDAARMQLADYADSPLGVAQRAAGREGARIAGEAARGMEMLKAGLKSESERLLEGDKAKYARELARDKAGYDHQLALTKAQLDKELQYMKSAPTAEQLGRIARINAGLMMGVPVDKDGIPLEGTDPALAQQVSAKALEIEADFSNALAQGANPWSVIATYATAAKARADEIARNTTTTPKDTPTTWGQRVLDAVSPDLSAGGLPQPGRAATQWVDAAGNVVPEPASPELAGDLSTRIIGAPRATPAPAAPTAAKAPAGLPVTVEDVERGLVAGAQAAAGALTPEQENFVYNETTKRYPDRMGNISKDEFISQFRGYSPVLQNATYQKLNQGM